MNIESMGMNAFLLANAAMANESTDKKTKSLRHIDRQEVEMIFNRVLSKTEFSKSDIRSLSRKKELCYARHLICYFISKEKKYIPKKIGELVNRDRTSVIHSIHTIEDLIFTKDQYLMKTYGDII